LFLTVRGIDWNGVLAHLLIPARYAAPVSAKPLGAVKGIIRLLLRKF